MALLGDRVQSFNVEPTSSGKWNLCDWDFLPEKPWHVDYRAIPATWSNPRRYVLHWTTCPAEEERRMRDRAEQIWLASLSYFSAPLDTEFSADGRDAKELANNG
jgi:hypothetical protein